MSTYTSANTVVRTVYGNSNSSEVKVGMHQGSALSPLQFVTVTVTEALYREFRVAIPCLLHTYDLVVIAETEDDQIRRLNEWKDNVENKGMRIKLNMNKTKVMINENCKLTRWPGGVCGKRIGNNSIQSTTLCLKKTS